MTKQDELVKIVKGMIADFGSAQELLEFIKADQKPDEFARARSFLINGLERYIAMTI